MYDVELLDARGQTIYVCLATGREAVVHLLRQVWRPRVEEAIVRKDGEEVYRWKRQQERCRSEAEHRDRWRV